MSDNEQKVAMYLRVGNKDQLCETHETAKEEQSVEEFTNCNGVEGGISMYEFFSVLEGYNEIAMFAMELVLTKGPDALMGQLDYDDIEFVKEHPAVYKRAIELGILTGEE